MKALGFVEVFGVVAAIEALDSMLKTADVELVTLENKLGGRLVTIVVTGSISAVQEAVENGRLKANAITKTVAQAIIANPHEEVIRLIKISAKKLNLAKSGEVSEF